jgi:hypothetical protein
LPAVKTDRRTVIARAAGAHFFADILMIKYTPLAAPVKSKNRCRPRARTDRVDIPHAPT